MPLLSHIVSLSLAIATSANSASVATAWYAGWHSEDFPLSAVPWSKYTQLTYAFAETTPDVNVLSFEGSNEPVLPAFVAAAHEHGVQASVSIGGWTGSRFFSTNVGSPQNRTAFVKTVVNLAKKYHLDGIDFDWEYPNVQGLGCNTINPNDTTNFLSFLRQLRRDPTGATLTLSAATSIFPFADADGTPSLDVSSFAQVLDYVAVMNYDIWGPWSTAVGPNAPLHDTCVNDPANQQGSAEGAVRKWEQAGMNAGQIVLGVPSYGHSFRVRRRDAFGGRESGSTGLAAYPAFDAADPPAGDSWDDGAGVDACGAPQSPGGNVDFWGMISLGYLDRQGNPRQEQDGNIAYRFDTCSQTPYIYNNATEIMVSFDNARSFAAKGAFIKQRRLRGFAMWEAGGDSDDILLDSIRRTAGFGN